MKIAADANGKLLADLSVEFRDELPYVIAALGPTNKIMPLFHRLADIPIQSF
jgi:hypothetical protein